ncbi:hypothetical protein M1P56_35170 (plasmid) [Streptomyces sp. HU2014]|uniref:hypothetical protein n=1 Tax=Streptomyces sp. HU2014 TaxID=2939414 RepID=UPI00200D1118|nr:hypothetical protein [Streptomyces sp. HU2014]UQI49755.1 hypothetical protein M1P56_35170 [Streptomyces sp. HU2014]
MTGPAPRSALAATQQFLDTFTTPSTREQRRTYLEEYLTHLATAQQRPASELTTPDLLDPDHITAWLTDAHHGLTRRRTGTHGPHTKPSVNSMAARTTTINTFTRHYGTPLGLPLPKPHFAPRLTPTQAHRTLRLLAAHQPDGILTPTWQRTVALIALAVCTHHGLPHLQPMRLHDLELHHQIPRARVNTHWYPLDTTSRDALQRWLTTHHALTAGHLKVLQGGDVAHLWVTTTPGRPRTGTTTPPAGLPAARRTLEAAHRTLTTKALGTPLLLEQFCGTEPDETPPTHKKTDHQPPSPP